MAQITNVTSEALQATLRRLLPSQQGFGEDLQASNVITPVIDLTASAEGSALPIELSTALAFGNATAFSINAGTADVISGTGFWRLVGVLDCAYDGNNTTSSINIIDSTPTTQTVWQYRIATGVSGNHLIAINIDLILFLNSGEKISITAGTDSGISGSVRQVADINGNIINPVGYNPQ